MRQVSVALIGDSPRVAIADAYRDGTVWFAIDGAADTFATVCLDGRRDSPTRHRLFDQAKHPRKPGAVLLELGSPGEGIVVPLVSRWLDSAEPRQLGLTEYGWELIRNALLRLGEPIVAREGQTGR